MSSKYDTDLRLAPALSIEMKSDSNGLIQGYASTFGGNPDRQGDIIAHGAFTKTLEEHEAQGTLPAMLWSHELETPIGKWLSVEEDRKGLLVSGKINLATSKGREAYEHVKAGDVGAFSIGYIVPEGGRKYLGKGVFEIKQVELAEISVVAVPANINARITAVKQLSSKSEAVEFLREAGLSKAAAARFAAGGFNALSHDDEFALRRGTIKSVGDEFLNHAELRFRDGQIGWNRLRELRQHVETRIIPIIGDVNFQDLSIDHITRLHDTLVRIRGNAATTSKKPSKI